MRLRTQILLTVLISVKLILGSILVYRIGWPPFLEGTEAIAAEGESTPAQAGSETTAALETPPVDFEFINQRMAALRAEEKRINQKRLLLQSIEKEISRKLADLTALRNEIRAETERRKIAEDQKVKHLIKAFSAMKPQSAASLIEKLDHNLAVELLSKMKGDQVGQILSYVKIEKAAKISEGLVRRKE